MQSINLAETTIVTINDSLSPDFVSAIEDNFPIEQRPPDWSAVANGLGYGYLVLHELRDKESGELLSARLLANYVSRYRGDPSFALICYAVTPSGNDRRDSISRLGKSQGYGSYLFHRSQELLREQMPHAIGLFGECETAQEAPTSERGAAAMEVNYSASQRQRRLHWMSETGRLQVSGYDYEIPPLPENFKEKSLVKDRNGKKSAGYLLLTPFEDRTHLTGHLLATIVEHLYNAGYAISSEDPYMKERLDAIDRDSNYPLKKLGI